eukprot:986432-Pyramimonas_sp.AAC.1
MKSKRGRCGFKRIDVDCFNALHALERVVEKGATMKAKVKKAAKNEPGKVKVMTVGLRTATKRSRSAKARSETAQFITTLLHSRSAKRVGKSFLLEKSQCIAWWMHNFGCTKEAATE